MTRSSLKSSKAPPPAGAYSQGLRVGDFVFISGQTPRSTVGGRLSGLAFGDQVRCVLNNINAIAEASGLSLRDAVKVDVFLRDIGDRDEFDMIYAGYVAEPLPARVLIQSGFIGFDVEVSAILAVGPK